LSQLLSFPRQRGFRTEFRWRSRRRYKIPIRRTAASAGMTWGNRKYPSRQIGWPSASRKRVDFKGHGSTQHPCLGSPMPMCRTTTSLRPYPLKSTLFRQPVFNVARDTPGFPTEDWELPRGNDRKSVTRQEAEAQAITGMCQTALFAVWERLLRPFPRGSPVILADGLIEITPDSSALSRRSDVSES
jgi:hypothetical protein